MTQTTGPFFDNIAKFMSDAAGMAQGAKAEFETVAKSQAERWLRSMDLPQREEFEAVKAMAEKARAENERLAARITELEIALARERTNNGTQSSQTLPQDPSVVV